MLPKEINSLIKDLAASITEYELRSKLHKELFFFFRDKLQQRLNEEFFYIFYPNFYQDLQLHVWQTHPP